APGRAISACAGPPICGRFYVVDLVPAAVRRHLRATRPWRVRLLGLRDLQPNQPRAACLTQSRSIEHAHRRPLAEGGSAQTREGTTGCSSGFWGIGEAAARARPLSTCRGVQGVIRMAEWDFPDKYS